MMATIRRRLMFANVTPDARSMRLHVDALRRSIGARALILRADINRHNRTIYD